MGTITLRHRQVVNSADGDNHYFRMPIGGEEVCVDFDLDLPRECKVVSYVPSAQLHLVVAKMKRGTVASLESRHMAFATILRQKGSPRDMIGQDIAVFPSSRFMFEIGPPASGAKLKMGFHSAPDRPSDNEIIVGRVCQHHKGLRAYLWTPINKMRSHIRSRLRNGIYRVSYRQFDHRLHRAEEEQNTWDINATVYVAGKANLAREFQSRVWMTGDRWKFNNVDLKRLTNTGWVDCWDLALELSCKN